MDILRSRKFRTYSDALVELYEPRELNEFAQHLIDVVRKLIGRCELSFDDVDLTTGEVTDLFTLRVSNHASWLARLVELIHENPVIGYIRAGGKEPVLKISDFMTQRELHRTGFYNDVMRPVAMEYQLAVALPLPGHATGLTLNRDRDFTENERLLLQLLSPHVVQAHANAKLLTSLRKQQARYPRAVPAMLAQWQFTPREAEVMRWMAEGKRDREIGIILETSHRTVEKHVQHILQKLGVETRSTAVARFMELSR
jgi:DNA-binding CsgD family transcriptional regulator